MPETVSQDKTHNDLQNDINNEEYDEQGQLNLKSINYTSTDLDRSVFEKVLNQSIISNDGHLNLALPGSIDYSTYEAKYADSILPSGNGDYYFGSFNQYIPTIGNHNPENPLYSRITTSGNSNLVDATKAAFEYGAGFVSILSKTNNNGVLGNTWATTDNGAKSTFRVHFNYYRMPECQKLFRLMKTVM